MAQDFKVVKAFQATVSKEDKTPKSFTSHGKELFVWKVQFEGHESKGWLNVNKQAGNEVKEGDVLYGDLTIGQWPDGKERYDFKGAQRPEGQSAPTPQASTPTASPATQAPKHSGDLEAKVDLVISYLEVILEHYDIQRGAGQAFPDAAEEDDINLDDINNL